MSERKVFTPNVQWYQSSTHVFCEIELVDVKNVVVDFETNEEKGSVMLFEGDCDGKHYMICIQLFDLIDDDRSFCEKERKFVRLVMKKKEEDEDWSRLQKDKNTLKNYIRVNWDKMDYEEEIPEQMMGGQDKLMEELFMRQMNMRGGNMMNGLNMDMEDEMNEEDMNLEEEIMNEIKKTKNLSNEDIEEENEESNE